MDDIIKRLKKLKDKKEKKASPLDDFFEPDEKETPEPDTDIGETGLDIKPLGKTAQEEKTSEHAATDEMVEEMPRTTSTAQSLAKGIRELSFNDLGEASGEQRPESDEGSAGEYQQVIELSTQDPEKIKHLKLIVALLEAEQYEAARQEIDNMIAM
jgi:hypothetical protein